MQIPVLVQHQKKNTYSNGRAKGKIYFPSFTKRLPIFGHGPRCVPVAYSPPSPENQIMFPGAFVFLFFFFVLDESNNGKSKSDAMSVIWGRNKAQGFIKKCEGATVKS